MKIRSFIIILFIAGLLVSSFAFALGQDEAKLPPKEYRLPFTGIPTEGKEVLGLIELVASWVFAIFVAISVIFIVMAAFEFITAEGDAAKIAKARQSLIYAVIGLIIATVAFGIPRVIRNIVVGSQTTQTQQEGTKRVSGLCSDSNIAERECYREGGTCSGNDCIFPR